MQEGPVTQVPAGSVGTESTASNVPLTYEVLRGPWKPYEAPESVGLEILIPESATEDEIVRLLRDLAEGKDPVSITVWTNRQVWENARRNIYDDLHDRHLICVYTKNTTVQRAYFGVDEIQWMQEEGRFSHLAGQTTPMHTQVNPPQAQPLQTQKDSSRLAYEVLRGPWDPFGNGHSLGLEILISESATVDEIVHLIRNLTAGNNSAFLVAWTSRAAYDNYQRNIYGDLYERHRICMYRKQLLTGIDEIEWLQQKGRFAHLTGQTMPMNTGPIAVNPQSSDLQTFTDVLKNAGVDSSIIARTSQREDTLTIVVGNVWHHQHYQDRLQVAQNLWKIWAHIRSPNDLDSARLKLTDLNGNVVGGSRLLAGSLIWVKKD